MSRRSWSTATSTLRERLRPRRPLRRRRRPCAPRRSRGLLGLSLELDFQHAGRGRRGLPRRRQRPVPGRSRPGVGRRNASPAPVGSSISIRLACTCSRTPRAITTAPADASVSSSSGTPRAEDALLAAERFELHLVQLQRGQCRMTSGSKSSSSTSGPVVADERAPVRRGRACRSRASTASTSAGSRRASARRGEPRPSRPTARASATVQGAPGSPTVISRSSPSFWITKDVVRRRWEPRDRDAERRRGAARACADRHRRSGRRCATRPPSSRSPRAA